MKRFVKYSAFALLSAIVIFSFYFLGLTNATVKEVENTPIVAGVSTNNVQLTDEQLERLAELICQCMKNNDCTLLNSAVGKTDLPTPTNSPTPNPTDDPTDEPTIEPTETPVPTNTSVPTVQPTPKLKCNNGFGNGPDEACKTNGNGANQDNNSEQQNGHVPGGAEKNHGKGNNK